MKKAIWAAVAATMLLAGCPADRDVDNTTINNPPNGGGGGETDVDIVNPPTKTEKKVEIHNVNPPADGSSSSTTTTTTTESED
jgi:hypothetical protein